MTESGIVFDEEFLRAYGCANCIWSDMDCPHNESRPESGYCEKLVNFLSCLSAGETTLSAVKEKYHLFIQELQVLSDRKEFIRLQSEYQIMLKDGAPTSELHVLEAQLNGYKLWWSRLSESLIKGLSRVVDRKYKVKTESSPKLTIQQLNILLSDSANKLTEHKASSLKLPLNSVVVDVSKEPSTIITPIETSAVESSFESVTPQTTTTFEKNPDSAAASTKNPQEPKGD